MLMTTTHSVEVDSPACPNCREPMRLIKLEPSFAGIPELRTFQCNECKLMMTMAHSGEAASATARARRRSF